MPLAASAPAAAPATTHKVVGERPENPNTLIYCCRLQARVHRTYALEEVLENDVKNADDVCGNCQNPCYN